MANDTNKTITLDDLMTGLDTSVERAKKLPSVDEEIIPNQIAETFSILEKIYSILERVYEYHPSDLGIGEPQVIINDTGKEYLVNIRGREGLLHIPYSKKDMLKPKELIRWGCGDIALEHIRVDGFDDGADPVILSNKSFNELCALHPKHQSVQRTYGFLFDLRCALETDLDNIEKYVANLRLHFNRLQVNNSFYF